jgi:hypothetical protein
MRKRTARRARARIDAKEVRDVWRVFADEGLAQRIAAVNAAIAPTAPWFWHVFKLRLAAREASAPVRDPEIVRQLAVAVLAEERHDLSGIVLRLTWRPGDNGRGVLTFEAGSEIEHARGVVQTVQATDRGRARAAARTMLAGR